MMPVFSLCHTWVLETMKEETGSETHLKAELQITPLQT